MAEDSAVFTFNIECWPEQVRELLPSADEERHLHRLGPHAGKKHYDKTIN
jgi:hypothetical protein